MKELLKKISSYNLFNYLLPGIAFALIASSTTKYKLLRDDLILGVFFYYFLGLIVSRVGSVLVEPILRRLAIVDFRPYKEFVRASLKDKKLDLLSEQNNTYRSFTGLVLTLVALKFWEILEAFMPVLAHLTSPFAICGLAILLVLAYRKQSDYIGQRIDLANKPSPVKQRTRPKTKTKRGTYV